MALAAALFGWARGPFWIAPVSAVGCLLLMIALGRDFGLRRWTSIGGAAILAANPDFVFQALQPMSDIPATCWSLAGIFCARRSRTDYRYAALAGFAFGVAALVRPTSILLLPALIVFLGIDFRRLATFGLGGLPALAFFAAYNVAAFGAPFRTGYGEAGLVAAFAWRNFPPRLLHYTHWLAATLTIAVLLGWIACLVDRNIARRDRAALGIWFLTTFVFYCFYGPYESWTFLRFLLPAMPSLVLGFLVWWQVAADRIAASTAFSAAGLLAMAAVAIVVFEMSQIQTSARAGRDRRRIPVSRRVRVAARQLPANAVPRDDAAFRRSSLLHDFSEPAVGRPSSPEQEKTVLAAIARRSRPIYALLFPFEERELPKSLPGNLERGSTTFEGLSLWSARPDGQLDSPIDPPARTRPWIVGAAGGLPALARSRSP